MAEGYTLGATAINQVRQLIRDAYLSSPMLLPVGVESIGRNVFTLAQADAYIARNAAGNYSVFHGNTFGSETDVGRTVSARCRMGGMPANAVALIVLIDGKLEAIKLGVELLGKTDAAHNKGATGTISIYSGGTAGSETDTGVNISAYCRFGNIGTGKWVYVFPGENTWEVRNAEC